jgi:hypothetical protein
MDQEGLAGTNRKTFGNAILGFRGRRCGIGADAFISDYIHESRLAILISNSHAILNEMQKNIRGRHNVERLLRIVL